METLYINLTWLFAVSSLFLWSNVCADAVQRKLFVENYGKFTGFSYGTQQIAFASSLLAYIMPGILGIQTTNSYVFEIMSLFYFALAEFLFWVKQNFGAALVVQAGVVFFFLIGILYECESGAQSVHFKLIYTIGRIPLFIYLTLYLTGIMTCQRDAGQKKKFYRELGRFSDANNAHIHANFLAFAVVPQLESQIVHKSEYFYREEITVDPAFPN